MQRFLAFRGDLYYPCEGMKDFIGDYATVDDAMAAINDPPGKRYYGPPYGCEWFMVWDSETREEVRFGQGTYPDIP